MYVALFLFPWLLMYALSTAVMNHRALFASGVPGGTPAYEKERELHYDVAFADNTDLRTISRQILSSVDLDGAHSVTRRRDGAVIITRNDLLTPRRLTFTPDTRILLIEKLPYRTNVMLERFHRRRGYATEYGVDTAWAVTVDLLIAAMLFWVLSGLWMWWEMKVTRTLGALALTGGAALFALFILAI
ncbi:MAG: hypothetical protein V7647_2070 [Acidobacteriota bacterium]